MPDLLLKERSYRDRGINITSFDSLILYTGLGLFFISLASFGGLAILSRAQMKAYNKIIVQTLDKEKNAGEDIANIFLLENKVKGINLVISQHVYPSGLLKFLEENTHPRVSFNGLSFDVSKNVAELYSEAENFLVLSRQINILERRPEIEEVEFSGISIGDGGTINFKLKLKLRPTLTQFPNPQTIE